MGVLQNPTLFSDETGDIYALSLLKGQQKNIPFQYSDNRDLTDYVLTPSIEWYIADLSTTGEQLSISSMELSLTPAPTVVPVVTKGDQATDPGSFNLHIPSTVHTGSNPEPNLTTGVPVASVLIEMDD